MIVWPARGRVQAWADRLLPVDGGTHRASPLPEDTPAKRHPGRCACCKGCGSLLLAVLAWQILQRLSDIDALVRAMQGEWLVQESLRALPGVAADDFARLLVFGGLWTLAISWLLAGFIFRRKRDEGMALYVAYLLLIFPFGIGPGTRPTPLMETLSFLGIAMGILFLFIFPDGRFVPQSRRLRGALVALILLAPPIGYLFARALRPGGSTRRLGLRRLHLHYHSDNARRHRRPAIPLPPSIQLPWNGGRRAGSCWPWPCRFSFSSGSLYGLAAFQAAWASPNRCWP